MYNKYGLGSWLQENAGTIGTIAGGAVGTVIAPGVGTSIGASIGGSIGGAVENNYDENQQESLNNEIKAKQNTIASAQALKGMGNIGSSFALGGDLNYLDQGNTHENGGINLPGTNNEVETKESIAKIDESNYVFSNRLKPKGSKLTFADMSKKIDKRYPRAKFDSIEKQDKSDEIRELMNQQELYKKDNSIGEYSSEYKCGGKMKYDGTSGTSKLDTSNMRSKFNSQLPSNFQSVGHAQRFFNANPDAFSDDLIVGGKGYGEGNIKNFGQKSLDNYNKVHGSKNQTIPIQGNTIESDIDMDLANVSSTELTKLDPLNKSNDDGSQDFNNPNAKYGAIGLGAGLLGNAYLYGTAKKQNINYDRVNPEQINLEAERQQARRTSSDTMNILASRLNSMGRGSSNSMIAGQTAVQRNLGDQLSNSYLSEQKYNTQARNRAGELNANIQMQEVEARAREEAAYNAQRRAAIQGALTSISQYGMGLASGERDINALKAFGTANYGASQGEDGINLGYTK